MPVLFITDGFVFFLLGMVIAYVFYARRHEHLKAPWRHVMRRPLAMSAAVVLVFYVVIGLLDSLHFHPKLDSADSEKTVYATGISSVLDVLLDDLGKNSERTYSAPLAVYAFSKETVELDNGTQTRDYPRLIFGGAHLDDPERDYRRDIIKRISVGFLFGIVISLIVFVTINFYLTIKNNLSLTESIRRCIYNRYDIPWYAILLTVSVITIICSVIVSLSGYYHVLGTDKVGQDVLYQALKSIRTGLIIGTLTTLVMLPFAIMMGLMAGYFGGWIDDVIQYLYTTLNSIPGVLLIAASILLLQVYIGKHEADFTSLEQRADLRLLFLCIILGITSWTGLCRLLRAETLKLREIDYVRAAQAFGVSDPGIMLRHLLPNVMHIVMISMVLDFSGLILAEAVLSYISIGVDPSMNSWGNMINTARLEMARDPIVWWPLAAAFMFMFLLVLAANLFSDAVRDAFDPRISGSM